MAFSARLARFFPFMNSFVIVQRLTTSTSLGKITPALIILLFYPAGAPRFPNSPPVQVDGYLGKETRVQCDPLGNPTPKIEWTRTPSAPLPRGRSEVRQDGLYIKNTESEDEGIYTCIAANEFGRVIQGAYLKVNSFSK